MENKSSKLSSKKKEAAPELDNGSFIDPLGRRKSKRFKASAVRDFPPHCGPSSTSLRSSEGAEQVKDMNLAEEDESFTRSGGYRSVGVKQLGGRKIIAVRDFPPNTGTKFSDYGKTVKDAVSKKELTLDSGDHSFQSPAKSMSPHVSKPLESVKSKFTIPKPHEMASKMKKREGVVLPKPLRLLQKINGDNGEGSSRKKPAALPPSRPSGSSSGDSARDKVMETLRLFSEACRKLIREEEANPRPKNGVHFNVSVEASKIVKSKGKYLNVGNKIIGTVPGVEVGDEFQYRIELNFLGIHRAVQAGIDFIRDDNKELLATSVVASGGYDDDLGNSDMLVYTGQGGNLSKNPQKGNINNEPKDQQLLRGNLALANSIDKQNPVRVIRGYKKTPSDNNKTYVYDGLYLVEEFWKEVGAYGKLVFKYRLRRIPGQPELTWKVVKKAKASKVREGLCCDDISGGKEKLPICAVNEIDDEKPPQFIYTVKMIYPDWCQPIPPKGCGCTKRCNDSTNCACVAKNGGELPYNYDGAIVFRKPMVYECGPLCKCSPDCYLRVTQRGIKIQLEIFKTEKRGWGVRSLESIPSGSFICEYTGELLQENEADRLAGKDEYLFDIGTENEGSFYDNSFFTIDAARKGNVGRFINHSCSPNLYAQDVLYHHEDMRIPHVMLFAKDNIPPLKELTYYYNYKIGQVLDADGNVKEKKCYCGSARCSGRLY
ncbi:unnamed protein product [Eruca vesicaria subsp. sativa]|uniref:Uncharacterized protein n=1 Tax=Eruca vesicaria subsp. sativa TaxID=29727 RepID=A0ABC8KFZ3_ERUVS|nr:unnamed protein product [Eruca vesicaria subsp. sativa]